MRPERREKRDAARLNGSVLVTTPDDCWPWQGTIDHSGYGIYRKGGRHLKAHKALYEELVGPVPDGMELDHKCRNRACCNPNHLEPVTHRENIIRGDTLPAKNARKTHCHRGHEFDSANTYTTPRGHRICRSCCAAHARKYRRAANVSRS